MPSAVIQTKPVHEILIHFDTRFFWVVFLMFLQARRRQAAHATDEKARQRLLGLADKACQDHDTQRMVAAALEGTFFNLIQVFCMCCMN